MNEKKSRPKSQIMMSPPQQHPNCSSSRKPGCDSLPSHRYENEWEIKERELAEARARASQMEKTMRWWSDCTANWREKWSLVRNERNQAREELRIAKLQLDEACRQMANLRRDPRSVSDVGAGVLTLTSSIPSSSSTFSNATVVAGPGNPKGIPHLHHSHTHSTINSYAQTDKMDKNRIASLEKQVTMLTLKLEESNRAIVFEREEKMILHRSVERLQRDVSDLQELYDNLKKELLISELLDKDDHEMSESVEVDIEEAEADDDIIDGSNHPDPYHSALETSLEQNQHQKETVSIRNDNDSFSQSQFHHDHDNNENEFSESNTNIDKLINDSTSMESEILQIIEASEKIFDSIFAETSAACESKGILQDKNNSKQPEPQQYISSHNEDNGKGHSVLLEDKVTAETEAIVEAKVGVSPSAIQIQTDDEVEKETEVEVAAVPAMDDEKQTEDQQECPALSGDGDGDAETHTSNEESENKTDEKECGKSASEAPSPTVSPAEVPQQISEPILELAKIKELPEKEKVELVQVAQVQPEPEPKPEEVELKEENTEEIKDEDTTTTITITIKANNSVVVEDENTNSTINTTTTAATVNDTKHNNEIVSNKEITLEPDKGASEAPVSETDEKKRDPPLASLPVDKKNQQPLEEVVNISKATSSDKPSSKSSSSKEKDKDKDKIKSKKDNDKPSGSEGSKKKTAPKPSKTKAK